MGCKQTENYTRRVGLFEGNIFKTEQKIPSLLAGEQGTETLFYYG